MAEDKNKMVLVPFEDLRKAWKEDMREIMQQAQPAGKKRFYSTEEAAEYLGIAIPTLYLATSKKKIKFYKSGRTLRFTKEQLDGYMEENSNS